MSKTITRLFDSHTEALAAITDLEAAGIDRDRISLVSNNADNWHAAHMHRGAKIDDGENETAEGAGKGAAAGSVLGGAGGLMAGLGMLAIPGLGPVVAAGWLVSTAAGAAIGAIAGGATVGLLGALKDAGHSDEEANVYAEGVRRGGTLVSVRVDDGDEADAQRILDGRGADAMARMDIYREDGWAGFDESAEPYTPAQIQVERERYRAL